MKWIDLGTIYEFEDRLGNIRQTAGCSLVGHFQFSQRLKQLWEILGEADSDRTWLEIYQVDPRLRHVVKCLLDLNGLQVDWFSVEQLSALLFSVGDEPGYLVQINTLERRGDDKGKESTLAEVIAGLAEDLTKAIELANEVPVQALSDIAEARADIFATPEEKEERQRAEILKQHKADSMSFKELMRSGE